LKRGRAAGVEGLAAIDTHPDLITHSAPDLHLGSIVSVSLVHGVRGLDLRALRKLGMPRGLLSGGELTA
jgi:hypothetical protein